MARSPETILNVDDDEPGRYVMSRILRQAGYRVVEAGTGAEAFELLGAERPQLVILDINLPDVSGIEVCRRIKQEHETSSVLVLQISATRISMPDRVEALDAGADSFLVEPVEPEELVAVVRSLLRLQAAEQALKASLVEKETLLRELNHRVKNNLQIISGLISLHSAGIEDAAVREKFRNLQNRVHSLSAIHEQLYRSTEVAELDLRDYIEQLSGQLCSLYREMLENIELTLSLDSVIMPLDSALHLGLIMNELLSNSLKHAFPDGRAGKIRIALERLENDAVRFSIADDGCGFDTRGQPETSLGLRLIRSMAAQLSADLAIEADEGTSVSLTFAARPDSARPAE